jgi:hypothetical protein
VPIITLRRGEPKEVTLSQDARAYTSEYIAALNPAQEPAKRDRVVGTLRALDLDRDWIELEIEGRHQRIVGLEDALDDVIGPLVNRRVTVQVDRVGKRLRFVDIDEV